MKKLLLLIIICTISLVLNAQKASVFVDTIPNTVELKRVDGKLYFFQSVKIDSVFCGTPTDVRMVCDGRTVYQKTVEIMPDPDFSISDEQYINAYTNRGSSWVVSSGDKTNYNYHEKYLGTILYWDIPQRILTYRNSNYADTGMIIREIIKSDSSPAFTIWILVLFMVFSIFKIFYPSGYYSFEDSQNITWSAFIKSIIVAVLYSISRLNLGIFNPDVDSNPPANWWILPILFIVPVIFRLTVFDCPYKKNWKRFLTKYKWHEIIKHIIPAMSFISWAVVYLMIADNLELTKSVIRLSLWVAVIFFVSKYFWRFLEWTEITIRKFIPKKT